MIPFFLGYAMLVWWPATVYRRRWQAFLAVAIGLGGLIALIEAHLALARATDNRIFAPVFQGLLIPFTGLVTAVGLFVAVLPRRHPLGSCESCGYDLIGARESDTVCPECGASIAVTPGAHSRRASGRSPPHEPEQHAQQQHAEREPGQEAPPDRTLLAGTQEPDS